MNEIEDSSELENIQIKIDRVRHFLEFDTPSLINYTEEITFCNLGDEISSIVFNSENFRSNLHIFDFDGTPLIFYGNGDNGHEISIDFPNEKLFKEDEYRTITLKYQVHALEKELKSTIITVYLYKGASIYVSLKECDDYEFNIQYWLSGDNTQSENEVLINGNGIKNYNIYSKATENNDNNLYIRIVHSIPKSLSYWYILGLVLGFIIVLFNWPFYHYNPTGIRYFAIISATVISFLVVIKGWLFQKEMVKRVILYDKVFIGLILLIFIEIFLMTYHFSFIYGK